VIAYVYARRQGPVPDEETVADEAQELFRE
jgi:hypothetical protein